MKFSITKSKAKLVIAIILALFTIISLFFSSIFTFVESKWISIPILLFLEGIVFFLLLTDIKLTENINRIFTMVAIIFAPFVSMQSVELLQQSLHMKDLKSYVVNYLIFLAVYLLFWLITTRIKYSVFISGSIAFLIGVINHYVLVFRGSPMQPWDIAAAKTAMNVVDNFIFSLDEYVISVILITMILFLLAASLKPIKRSKKSLLITSAVVFLIMIGSVVYPSMAIYKNRGKFVRDLWDQTYSSACNGYTVNFLLNLQLMSNDPPENYSVETIDKILGNYTSDADNGNKPNIIVIMNEAFADLNAIDDLGLSQDAMPFVHSLKGADNSVTGNLNVSIFGGGTCNTEYEFLTSNISEMLRSGSYPMQQFIDSQSVSLATNLKLLGYKTVGIHPFYGSGWNRMRSYPLLGFDEFISLEDFDDDAEVIRTYISDQACYERVIEENEKAGDQPVFIFAVTMQNHGGYVIDWPEMPSNVQFATEEKYTQLNQYLELIKLSDDAIKDLVEYYVNQERDTILVFFGDHQPNIGEEYDSVFVSAQGNSLKNVNKKYQVPYFIWANFDIDEETIENISPNYLAPLVLEKAKMPQTAYYKYLNDLRKEIPSISRVTCIDHNDQLFQFTSKDSSYAEKINEYDILQYNIVFDKENIVSNKFMYATN